MITSYYFIPVLLNINSSALGKAYAASKSLGDNVEVKLFVVRDEGFDNEGCNGSFTSTHLDLRTIRKNKKKRSVEIFSLNNLYGIKHDKQRIVPLCQVSP